MLRASPTQTPIAEADETTACAYQGPTNTVRTRRRLCPAAKATGELRIKRERKTTRRHCATPVMPIKMLEGSEQISTESVASFIRRIISDWEVARENLKWSVGLQQKYYDCKHKDMTYKIGELVFLSTRNLKMKGIPGKLQRRFVGPFRVIETIGQQAYRLSLPDDWKIHPVFYVSLLKQWNSVNLQEDQPVSHDNVPEVEEPYYEIERILRWRKIKRKNKLQNNIWYYGVGTRSRMQCGLRPINLAIQDNSNNIYMMIIPRRRRSE